jgi:hypothetical protein
MMKEIKRQFASDLFPIGSILQNSTDTWIVYDVLEDNVNRVYIEIWTRLCAKIA